METAVSKATTPVRWSLQQRQAAAAFQKEVWAWALGPGCWLPVSHHRLLLPQGLSAVTSFHRGTFGGHRRPGLG